jgi:hypothetical protein
VRGFDCVNGLWYLGYLQNHWVEIISSTTSPSWQRGNVSRCGLVKTFLSLASLRRAPSSDPCP